LSIFRRVDWPKGAVKHQVEIRIPRGVLVRGKVTEAGSGKPVAGAAVQFWPFDGGRNRIPNVITGWQTRELTGADGTFTISVMGGVPGHLLVQGPTPDYVHVEIGTNVLHYNRPGGSREYPDAFLKLDPPLKGEVGDVQLTLRPGVTIRGQLLGADGKPVAQAVMLHRMHVFHDLSWHFAGEARGGCFEIHGLDPEGTCPVFFLDAKRQQGAVVELSGKQAGQEVTVRLAPCGKATARYVDAKRKPLANYQPSPDIVITPGRWPMDPNGQDRGELTADQGALINLDRHNYWYRPKTGADGRVTFPALIPGATYRISRWDKNSWLPHKEFQVGAGKTIDLGDIPINQNN
jgi:protocatechuate 3,4-dioxygenase beta subunit